MLRESHRPELVVISTQAMNAGPVVRAELLSSSSLSIHCLSPREDVGQEGLLFHRKTGDR